MNNSHDLIHRFIFDNTDMRGEITTLHKSYLEALNHQKLPQNLKSVFGEFLAASALLSEMLKFDGILTLQAKGDGAIGLIMAECNNAGHVRGVVRFNDHATPLAEDTPTSLNAILGNGHLSITIDPEQGERYQGIVALEGESLADSLSAYFSQSEQLPTMIKLSANDQFAGGIFIQCLPAQMIKNEETRANHWQTAVQLTHTYSAEELYQLPHETLLYRLYHELSCRMFPAKDIQFKCSCSKERSANALVSIGKEEVNQLMLERGQINIDCEFCGAQYEFTQQDISELFKPQTLH